MDKIKVSQTFLNIIITLILAAYGYIFTMTTGRITKVEEKMDNINPVLLQIQTNLAEISTDIKWLKSK